MLLLPVGTAAALDFEMFSVRTECFFSPFFSVALYNRFSIGLQSGKKYSMQVRDFNLL